MLATNPESHPRLPRYPHTSSPESETQLQPKPYLVRCPDTMFVATCFDSCDTLLSRYPESKCVW